MEIPEKVEEWTLDTVKEVVRKHEFEPGRFDYKAVLQPATRTSGPDHIPSIRRTVCSMANADGGFILFGVLDRRIMVHAPEERIVGIPLGRDLLKEFGDKINVIQPEVYFEATPAPIRLPDPAKCIFVVRVPTSPRRPHMVGTTGIFYRRGPNGAAVPMDYYEVRDQMLYTEERYRKVTLLRLMLAQYFAQVQKLPEVASWNQSNRFDKKTVYFDTSAYTIILNDASAFLPTSDELLKDLLEISVEANILQGIVVTEGPGKAVHTSHILHNLCNKCLQRLTELFGPIGSEGRPPASS